jgi:hypothetical protein
MQICIYFPLASPFGILREITRVSQKVSAKCSELFLQFAQLLNVHATASTDPPYIVVPSLTAQMSFTACGVETISPLTTCTKECEVI